jgi:hypothetical protein
LPGLSGDRSGGFGGLDFGAESALCRAPAASLTSLPASLAAAPSPIGRPVRSLPALGDQFTGGESTASLSYASHTGGKGGGNGPPGGVRSLSGLGGGFGSGAGAGPLLSDEPGAQPSAEAEEEEEGEEEEEDSDEGVHDEICGGGHGFADRAEETELSARHGKKEQTAS